MLERCWNFGGTFVLRFLRIIGLRKKVDFSIDADQESLTGTINYVNPNYNFLGNSLGYSLGSLSNDKPDQGYENTLISAGVNTRSEQFKNLYSSLGLSFMTI